MNRLAAPKDAIARREQYNRDGVILVPQLFNKDEIDHIRSVFTDQVEADKDNTFANHDQNIASDDILTKYHRFVHPHRHPDTEAGQIARTMLVDKRVMTVVEQLVGPAYGAQTMFYFKPPTARGQAFHQDNHFLRTHPEVCIATWIAVDDADAENGGLIFYPGSHQNGIMCHGEADQTEFFNPSQLVNLPKSLGKVQTDIKAGDAFFFHGQMVHGSGGNSSKDRFRRSLIFHHCPQASKEIYKFYQPLINSHGEEVYMDEADQGGPCGVEWSEEP